MFLGFVVVAEMIVALAFGVYAWRLARAERLRSEARVAALAAAIDSTSPTHTVTSMFEREPKAGLQGRPLLKVAVGFGMAVLVIVLIAMSGQRPKTVDVVQAAAAPNVGPQSLELLSMRHERAGDSLKVTGLVRNRGAATDGSIMAVVFVFDRDGGFVASARAPLEFGSIANGDESPFQVTIPDVKDVGRYRVSFRTATGVVPHVDRRAMLQVSSAN